MAALTVRRHSEDGGLRDSSSLECDSASAAVSTVGWGHSVGNAGLGRVPGNHRGIGVDVLGSQVLGNGLSIGWLVCSSDVRIIAGVVEAGNAGVGLILVFVHIGVGGGRPAVAVVVDMLSAGVTIGVVIDTAAAVLDQTGVDGTIAGERVLTRVSKEEMFCLLIS